MEFLLYLNPQGQQIIRDLISAKFQVNENIGLCRTKNIFGYTAVPNKFIICTKNIKNGGWDMNRYIPETVYHEAFHATQICNGNQPLGISKKYMPLPSNKLKDVQNSFNVVSGSLQKEHEAYYFEDKPDKVVYYVRKFCF
jgi:hypothetical protein